WLAPVVTALLLLTLLTPWSASHTAVSAANGSGLWVPTGSMHTARYKQTATLLPDGRVLVAGGSGASCGPIASAEVYDPSTGTWSVTGSMTIARVGHSATLLPNGEVLVVGGSNPPGCCTPLASAELYNPATGTWTATGRMHTARYSHLSVL